MVSIKSYPAKNGDAFLVKATDSKFLMLIDGGYAETFQQNIRFDLASLAAAGYKLDLVVATHVDADHISGLIKFFELNERSTAPRIIQVDNVFHNSVRGLTVDAKDQIDLTLNDASLLNEICRHGYPPPTSIEDAEQEIGARQGSSLAKLLLDGGYQWNTHDGTVCVGEIGLRELLFPNVRVEFLGPSKKRLDALKTWWISEIRRLGMVGRLERLDDAFEFLCAREPDDLSMQLLSSPDGDLAQVHLPDASVTNGSSISLVVEVENSRLLFLGDAWADDTVLALAPNGRVVFDAIKVSHHGSSRNTSVRLLELIDAPHFFVSTNGDTHNHPDFSVLKAIVDRPASFHRLLHLNYSTPASRMLSNYRSESGSVFTVDENQTDWVVVST